MRDMNYNKESFKSSVINFPKEELVLLHSSIRVAMAKTPREKRGVINQCERLKKVVFGDDMIERLEGLDRKVLLSMLNTTNGILMKKSYSETGRTNW
jgi:hypothetical protein